MKVKKGFIYSEQIPMFGHKDIIGYGTDEFHVKEIDRKEANKTIIKNHYSKKVYNGTYINLGVFIKGGSPSPQKIIILTKSSIQIISASIFCF